MKNIVLTAKLILLIVISSIISSCSDDDPVTIALYLPIANFSYETFDKKVVFTDKSENADSYYWTFGDGETSTEQNPTHFFKANKKYSVELTIRGERGKTSTKKVTIDFSDGTSTEDVNITLDGNFSDWAAVPASMLATSTIAPYVTDLVALKEVKLCANSDYIFFYIKANDNAKFSVAQFYIDMDNDSQTGFAGWYWEGIGSEYVLEGEREKDLDPDAIGVYDISAGDWPWKNVNKKGSKAIEISAFIAGEDGTVEVEGRIFRSEMPDLGKTIKMGVALADAGWAVSGLLPSKQEDAGLSNPLTVKLP